MSIEKLEKRIEELERLHAPVAPVPPPGITATGEPEPWSRRRAAYGRWAHQWCSNHRRPGSVVKNCPAPGEAYEAGYVQARVDHPQRVQGDHTADDLEVFGIAVMRLREDGTTERVDPATFRTQTNHLETLRGLVASLKSKGHRWFLTISLETPKEAKEPTHCLVEMWCALSGKAKGTGPTFEAAAAACSVELLKELERLDQESVESLSRQRSEFATVQELLATGATGAMKEAVNKLQGALGRAATAADQLEPGSV